MRFEIKQEKQVEVEKPTTLELVKSCLGTIVLVAAKGEISQKLLHIHEDGTYVKSCIIQDKAKYMGIQLDRVNEFKEDCVTLGPK